MFKRFELHNHTNESDGSLSVNELINHMIDYNVDVVAITDHNTTSAHEKCKQILKNSNLSIEAIYGVELTTYYGHILCLNLSEYVNWEDINYHKPEILFEKIRKIGGLVGIAHPFSKGAPFSKGCKWEMDISDYSYVDFIEIFNNPEPTLINEKALNLWEELVINGEKLAMTTGMDLHGKGSLDKGFYTYVKVDENEAVDKVLEKAIKNCKTFISKIDVFEGYIDDGLRFRFYPISKDYNKDNLVISVTSKNFSLCENYDKDMVIDLSDKNIECGDAIVVKVYEDKVGIENLLAISPIIYY
ncbi:CehA/McbA family metallohydrolase [Faecalimicrobium sp. JNUCC 81]